MNKKHPDAIIHSIGPIRVVLGKRVIPPKIAKPNHHRSSYRLLVAAFRAKVLTA